MGGGRGGEGPRRRSSEGGWGGGEKVRRLRVGVGENGSGGFCRAGQILADTAISLPTEGWFLECRTGVENLWQASNVV